MSSSGRPGCPASRGWAGGAPVSSRAAGRPGPPSPWPHPRRARAGRARLPRRAAGWPASAVRTSRRRGADPRLGHRGPLQVETSARTSRTDSSTAAAGRGRRPGGGPRCRAPPAVTGPVATTSPRPRGGSRPEPTSWSRVSSSAAGPVASAVHRCGGATTIGPPGGVGPAPGRRARRGALGGQRRARPGVRAGQGPTGASRGPGASGALPAGVGPSVAARLSSGSASTASSDDDPRLRRAAPRRRWRPPGPPSTASAVRTTARLPAAATSSSAGSSSAPSAGQVIASTDRCTEDAPRRSRRCRTRRAARGRRASPRANATRSASANGSATTHPPRSSAARPVQPPPGDLRAGAGRRRAVWRADRGSPPASRAAVATRSVSWSGRSRRVPAEPGGARVGVGGEQRPRAARPARGTGRGRRR